MSLGDGAQGRRPPRVVVTGMPRAGSTRLYNVIRDAAARRHPDLRYGTFGEWKRLAAALADPTPGVFKEHTFDESVVQRVRRGDVQAVATIREPLEAMVSICATFGQTPEEAARWVDEPLTLLEQIAASARIYVYETAVSGNPATIRRILSSIGLSVRWHEASKLAYRWRRARTVRLSARMDGHPMTFDPVNLLHPGHVGRGRTVDDSTLTALQDAARVLRLRPRVEALARLAA